MMGHKIGFYGEILKITPKLYFLPLLVWSTVKIDVEGTVFLTMKQLVLKIFRAVRVLWGWATHTQTHTHQNPINLNVNRQVKVTLEGPKGKISEFANKVDADEVAHYELSHLVSQCLPSSLLSSNKIPLVINIFLNFQQT